MELTLSTFLSHKFSTSILGSRLDACRVIPEILMACSCVSGIASLCNFSFRKKPVFLRMGSLVKVISTELVSWVM